MPAGFAVVAAVAPAVAPAVGWAMDVGAVDGVAVADGESPEPQPSA